jgi:hypothetical protein
LQGHDRFGQPKQAPVVGQRAHYNTPDGEYDIAIVLEVYDDCIVVLTRNFGERRFEYSDIKERFESDSVVLLYHDGKPVLYPKTFFGKWKFS